VASFFGYRTAPMITAASEGTSQPHFSSSLGSPRAERSSTTARRRLRVLSTVKERLTEIAPKTAVAAFDARIRQVRPGTVLIGAGGTRLVVPAGKQAQTPVKPRAFALNPVR